MANRGVAAKAAVSKPSMKSTLSGTRSSVSPTAGMIHAPMTRQVRPDAIEAEIRRSTSMIPA